MPVKALPLEWIDGEIAPEIGARFDLAAFRRAIAALEQMDVPDPLPWVLTPAEFGRVGQEFERRGMDYVIRPDLILTSS